MERLQDDGRVVWREGERGPVVEVLHAGVGVVVVVVLQHMPCEEQLVVVAWIPRSIECSRHHRHRYDLEDIVASRSQQQHRWRCCRTFEERSR